MAWLAVDKNGDENVYYLEPERDDIMFVYMSPDVRFVELPKGSIEKLIGRPLKWDDEPVELKQYKPPKGINNNKMTTVNFGLALEALKQGKRVARQGWNGKGMFIFMRPADELNIDFVIDKVKSLPQSVKDYYLQDITNERGERVPAAENDTIKFTAYICMKAADGSIVNGWLASQTDILSEDWMIL